MLAGELSRLLQAEMVGDPSLEILGVAPLRKAGEGELSFLSNPKYQAEAMESRAGAILVGLDVVMPGRCLLRCGNPYAAFARALALFHPEPAAWPGTHPSAVVEEGAAVSPSASIGPFAVIGAGTRIGQRTSVGAGTVIGRDCTVGDDCRLLPRVVLYDGSVLHDRVVLHSGCVIGSDGFGYAWDGLRHLKVPQVGRVVIESDVEIGANATVDRGTLEETRIGRGTKVDNLVQVAHNVSTGPDCILVAQSGISGSTSLGAGVILAGQSGIVGHVNLGDGVKVGAKSAVTKDTPAGAFVTGHPAQDHRLWLKERALAGRLEEMLQRIRRIEKRLEEEEPR